MKSYHSGWVTNAGQTDFIHKTVDLETETGCVYLVHDDDAVTKKDFEFLMFIEENYPKLLHSDEPLFMPPENESDITPEIDAILHSDTETLINTLISYFKNGQKGKLPVPERLIEICPYNLEIISLIKRLCE